MKRIETSFEGDFGAQAEGKGITIMCSGRIEYFGIVERFGTKPEDIKGLQNSEASGVALCYSMNNRQASELVFMRENIDQFLVYGFLYDSLYTFSMAKEGFKLINSKLGTS